MEKSDEIRVKDEKIEPKMIQLSLKQFNGVENE